MWQTIPVIAYFLRTKGKRFAAPVIHTHPGRYVQGRLQAGLKGRRAAWAVGLLCFNSTHPYPSIFFTQCAIADVISKPRVQACTKSLFQIVEVSLFIHDLNQKKTIVCLRCLHFVQKKIAAQNMYLPKSNIKIQSRFNYHLASINLWAKDWKLELASTVFKWKLSKQTKIMVNCVLRRGNQP